jgi:hypothetical protein
MWWFKKGYFLANWPNNLQPQVWPTNLQWTVQRPVSYPTAWPVNPAPNLGAVPTRSFWP